MAVSISTKTGDQGESGLANGERLPKTNQVFGVVGSLDELNSWLGLIVAQLSSQFDDQRDFLRFVQDGLFHMGAELARSPKTKLPTSFLKKIEIQTEQLQQQMAEDWVTKFLLPGGAPEAAHIDVARTVCRRFERSLIHYGQQVEVRALLMQSINRLSDYLFVLRTWVNLNLGYTEMIFDKKGSYTKELREKMRRS